MSYVDADYSLPGFWKSLDNSEPLNLQFWDDGKEIDSAVDSLMHRFRLDSDLTRIAANYQVTLKVLLLNLNRIYYNDPAKWLGISLDKNYYSIPKRYNPARVTYWPIRNLVTWLRDRNLIQFAPHLHTDQKRRTSRIRATKPLIRFLADRNVSVGQAHLHPRVELLVLKDRVKVKVRDKKEGKLKSKIKKVPVDYAETATTRKLRAFIKQYNNFLVQHQIESDSRPLMIYEKVQYRVFNNNSWQQGGRWVGGTWQNMKKNKRPYIRINGSLCVELDYSNFHVMLAYAELGIQWTGDAYALESVPNLPAAWRKELKKTLLTMLNARTMVSAKRSIQRRINKKKHLLPKLKPWELLHYVERQHHRLRPFFGTDFGLRMMFKESQITTAIYQDMLRRDIPCLGIHDSYVVPIKDEESLRKSMISNYLETNSGLRINIDKRF